MPSIALAIYPILIPMVLYLSSLSLSLFPSVQRELIYMHHVKQFWRDHNDPVARGFAPGQVTPFYVMTPDGERLHSWHVLSLDTYARHETVLREAPTGLATAFDETESYRIVREGALRGERNLIVYFHGNGASLVQGLRAQTYHHLLAAAPPDTSLLTVDYRGFGVSSGTPSEAGLTTDGLTVLKYAVDQLGFEPGRILVVGHSLGTAVATATLRAWGDWRSADYPEAGAGQFAGLILVSGFSDFAKLLQTWKIGGVIPLLGPMRRVPGMHDLFLRFLIDTWKSIDKLEQILRRANDAPRYIEILTAKDDRNIGYFHSNYLFAKTVAMLKSSGDGTPCKEHANGQPQLEHVRSEDGRIVVRKEILDAGGHNNILLGSAVQLAVMRVFNQTGKPFDDQIP